MQHGDASAGYCLHAAQHIQAHFVTAEWGQGCEAPDGYFRSAEELCAVEGAGSTWQEAISPGLEASLACLCECRSTDEEGTFYRLSPARVLPCTDSSLPNTALLTCNIQHICTALIGRDLHEGPGEQAPWNCWCMLLVPAACQRGQSSTAATVPGEAACTHLQSAPLAAQAPRSAEACC